jgi:cytoskeletal protein RodZ
MLPAQGFFNSLIYFYSPMTQTRRSTIKAPVPPKEATGVLDDNMSLWGGFRLSFSRKRSSASTVPVPPAFQAKEFQELDEDEPVVQHINTAPAVCEENVTWEDLEVVEVTVEDPDHIQQK